MGKQLRCHREPRNIHDVYTVAVVEEENIVGHVARSISPVCNLFITRGGTIDCEITGPRQYSSDLPQGGLELPCKLLFSGSTKDIAKVENLLNKAPSTVFNESARALISCSYSTSDLADNHGCPAKSCVKSAIQQSSMQLISSASNAKSSVSIANFYRYQ